MLLKWLDAREATAAGIALADDFHLQSASNVPRARIKDGGQRPQEPELQKFLLKSRLKKKKLLITKNTQEKKRNISFLKNIWIASLVLFVYGLLKIF